MQIHQRYCPIRNKSIKKQYWYLPKIVLYVAFKRLDKNTREITRENIPFVNAYHKSIEKVYG